MSKSHPIVTEYDGRFHWWCSYDWDTGNRVQLHQHLDHAQEARL